MNASDWITATGGSYLRRGGSSRPMNPRLVQQALDHGGKAYQRMMLDLATRSSRGSQARSKRMRRQYLLALISEPPDPLPSRRRSRAVGDTSIYAQSRPGYEGLAAVDRHTAAVRASLKTYRPGPAKSRAPELGLNYRP